MFASDKLLLRSAKRGRERKVNRNDICLDIKIHNYTYRIRKAVWGLSPGPGIVSRVLSSGGLSAGYFHQGDCQQGIVIGELSLEHSHLLSQLKWLIYLHTVIIERKKFIISRGEEQVDGS